MNSDIGMVPVSHQLPSNPSPFIDSGVHLDLLARSASGQNVLTPQLTNDLDDDVFIHPDSPVAEDINVLTSSSSIESSSSSNTVVTETNAVQSAGLSRSRRSHFSRKDSTPETAKTTTKGDGK